MFTRMANGWDLIKQSWRVLQLDKELLIFPLLSGISTILVLASFAIPMWQVGAFEQLQNDPNPENNPLWYAIAFAYYFVNYFVIIFFNTALIGGAIVRLRGGDPTIGSCLTAAMNRLPQIFGWALVSATVGMILKVIESRSEKFGAIVADLIGMAWSITTFFVIPVLVVEKLGPVEAVKRSMGIMRKTWGESLGATFGMSLIGFLLCIPAFGLVIGGGYCLATGMPEIGIALIIAGILGIILVSLITSALDGIVTAALYLYAAEETMTDYFDSSQLSHAFARK